MENNHIKRCSVSSATKSKWIAGGTHSHPWSMQPTDYWGCQVTVKTWQDLSSSVCKPKWCRPSGKWWSAPSKVITHALTTGGAAPSGTYPKELKTCPLSNLKHIPSRITFSLPRLETAQMPLNQDTVEQRTLRLNHRDSPRPDRGEILMLKEMEESEKQRRVAEVNRKRFVSHYFLMWCFK